LGKNIRDFNFLPLKEYNFLKGLGSGKGYFEVGKKHDFLQKNNLPVV